MPLYVSSITTPALIVRSQVTCAFMIQIFLTRSIFFKHIQCQYLFVFSFCFLNEDQKHKNHRKVGGLNEDMARFSTKGILNTFFFLLDAKCVKEAKYIAKE